MADLEFIADYSDLQTMRRELVGVAKDAKQSAGVFEREYRKVERQLASSAKANQTFFNSVLGVDREMKSASKSADVFTRELQRQEKATEAYNKETQRLKLQYNSTYRAAQSFKTQLGELNEAHRRGAISTDRHEQQVRELKTEYRAFLNGTATGMNQFGNIASKNTRVMKRFGAVGMQQVGYQVQDFAVQVQSGTSAMVALGQQGSQLLGIFGPYGAIAGMILAIGTGLAGAFMAADKAAKDAADSAENFENKLASAKSEVTSMNEALELMASGFENAFEKTLSDRVDDAREKLEEAEEAAQKFRDLVTSPGYGAAGGIDLSGLFGNDPEDQLEAAEAAVDAARMELAVAQELLRQQEQRERSDSVINQLYEARMILREQEKQLQEDMAERQEVIQGTVSSLNVLWGNVRDRITEGVNAAGAMADRASEIQRILSGRSGVGRTDPVVMDPRDPRYDPVAAEMARIREQTEFYSPPSVSSGGGGGSVASGASAAADQVDRLNQALAENEKLMLSVGETVASSFGDALMSIVDGSKSAADAFRDMARRILKQAFDMLVVQPIMNSIMGVFSPGPGMSMGAAQSIVSQLPQALLQANGGVWNKGVQMYANGGVVNGATAFAHSGGLGVMGEAGPEAIMPLKRGKNGKLGVQVDGESQGNVTVEQHFHVHGNGDEYIMGKIQQAAPQLANYTQQQMLDQRRRGGVVKSTFG